VPPIFKDMLEFTFDSFTYEKQLIDYGIGESEYDNFLF